MLLHLDMVIPPHIYYLNIYSRGLNFNELLITSDWFISDNIYSQREIKIRFDIMHFWMHVHLPTGLG